MTRFYDSNLLLEEGNNCFELNKRYGQQFVSEQQFALQDNWNEKVMYQKLCHVAMKDDQPFNDDIKGETLTMIATFGRKSDFDFEINLVEETIPSHRNAWNTWIGNGNSEMDPVSQANGIDKTQLSNGHRKRPKKRAWKYEPLSNMIHVMEEGTQLNEVGIQNDTVWLHDLGDNSSMARTQMCPMKKSTTVSWRNGSCNGPAAPFKTMWTQYGSFGKLQVSDTLWEPVSNLDDRKLEFCGERSSEKLYNQKRKPNSTALQLLGENWDVATKNDVSESKEQNISQRLSLKHKSLPIGCTENTKNKGEDFSRRSVEKSLFLWMMMMDDSRNSHKRQIDCLSMKRLENQFCLIYLPGSHATSMRKCVAEQIIANWPTFLAYLEIYSLDVEVIMEVELNELKHLGNILFGGSQKSI